MNKLTIITAILLAIACSTATAQFEGGDGSAGNPYQIATPAQLDSIREDGSENFLDDHYVLTKDLDFEGYTYADGGLGWQPIAHDTRGASGHQGGKFTGSFNGRGFAIHNLKINRPNQDFVGLFGHLHSSAEVDSLGMEAVDILGDSNVGGLVGFNSGGRITNSYAIGQVRGDEGVGGLIGSNNGTISASYATVEVDGNGNSVGGLVGGCDASSAISHSYAAGQVRGNADNMGGLVGWLLRGTIENSYATGQVRGNGSRVGGLVGSNQVGTIKYSYAVGQVEGTTTNVGGLVGFDITGVYVSSYWNTEISGQDAGAGNADQLEDIAGLTTAQMYNAESFDEFDFYDAEDNADGVWDPPTENEHFPQLRAVSKNGQVLSSFVSSRAVGSAPFALPYTLLPPTLYEEDGLTEIDVVVTSSDEAVATIDANTGEVTIKEAGTTTLTISRAGNAQYAPVSLSIELLVHPFAVGTGTKADPFQVSTSAQLDAIRNQESIDLLDTNYVLTADLDFTGYAYADGDQGWNPIGSSDVPFTGSFNGQGFAIQNLLINRPGQDNVGLFGNVDGGAIDSLGVEAIEVTGNNNVGGLVGDLRNSTISNSYANGNITGNNNAGGLVGNNDNSSTINNSHATGQVEGENRVGGLVGENDGSMIRNSYATGQVTGNGDNVGGLVGNNQRSTIHNSYATGNVTGEGNGTGGLVSNNGLSSTIRNSYATGNVTGSNTTGGLAAVNSGTIRNSYATGNVTGSNTTGGLVGHNNDATVTASYWNKATSGQTTSADGTGLTTAEMYAEASFMEWDFTTIWWPPISEVHFPLLREVYGPQYVSIAADATTASEADGATFTLERSGGLLEALDVTVSVAETGNFIDGAAPESVTFAEGATTATLTLNTEDDDTNEEDGSITATVEEGTGYAVIMSQNNATVTITDDDLPKVTIAPNEASITEGENAVFTLTRVGILTDPLAVDVLVKETGSAFIAGNAPTMATFLATESTVTITLNTTDDDKDEPNGIITVTVESGDGYGLGTPSVAEVSVEDDDDPEITITAGASPIVEGTPAIFTLTRGDPNTDAPVTLGELSVMVSVTQSGEYLSGMAPTSATFANGSSTATLTIDTQDDDMDEADGTITAAITLGTGYSVSDPAEASVSVTDNDLPTVTIAPNESSITEGEDAVFTLTRAGVLTEALSVTISVTQEGNFATGNLPTSISFNATESTVTLTIPTTDDTEDTPSGQIMVAIESSAEYAIGAESTATVAVADDDGAADAEVSILANNRSVNEGADAIFTLTRTTRAGALTVNVSITEQGDYISGVAPTTAIFVDGSAVTMLMVPTEDDATDEPGGVITATVEPGTGYTLGGTFSAEVGITDDDGAADPEISITTATPSVLEGTGAFFTLTRTIETGTLTVNVGITEQGDYIIGMAPTTVDFAEGERTARLTVATNDDAIDEPNGIITATIEPGAGYIVGDPFMATIGITDDDGAADPEVSIVVVSSSVAEGAEAEFTLTRTTMSGTLKVSLEVTEQGDYIDGIAPMSVSFTDGSLTATLSVATEDDETVEEMGVVTATVAQGTGYTVGDPSSAEVTIMDNDGNEPVGISDESGVVLYPNPVKGQLHVRLPQGGQVSIYTLQGRWERTYRIQPGAESTSLDVSALSAGIYVVILTDNKGRSVYYRVVKE